MQVFQAPRPHEGYRVPRRPHGTERNPERQAGRDEQGADPTTTHNLARTESFSSASPGTAALDPPLIT